MIKSLGKHIFFVVLAMSALVIISWCSKKEQKDTVDTVNVQEENVNDNLEEEFVATWVEESDLVAQEDIYELPEIPEHIAEKFKKYSLFVEIISKDEQGTEYGVKTVVNKDDTNIAYTIEEMTGPSPLPFESLRNVLLDNDFYMNIALNGEEMWFKAPSVEDQAATMFDLARMHTSLEDDALVKDIKKETIEWEEMECYYLEWPTNSKACVLDGVFAYGEDVDPTTGISSIIRVSDYSTDVDQDAFSLPPADQIKDMSELMWIMMAQQAQAVVWEEGKEGLVVSGAVVGTWN